MVNYKTQFLCKSLYCKAELSVLTHSLFSNQPSVDVLSTTFKLKNMQGFDVFSSNLIIKTNTIWMHQHIAVSFAEDNRKVMMCLLHMFESSY